MLFQATFFALSHLEERRSSVEMPLYMVWQIFEIWGM
jgi:hypothetical protein